MPLYFEKDSLVDVTDKLISSAKEAEKNGEPLFKIKGTDFPLLNTKPIANALFNIHPISEKVKSIDKYNDLLKRKSQKRVSKINLNESAQDDYEEEDEEIQLYCLYDELNDEMIKIEDNYTIAFSSLDDTKDFILSMPDSLETETEKNTLIDKMKNWKILVMKNVSTIDIRPKV